MPRTHPRKQFLLNRTRTAEVFGVRVLAITEWTKAGMPVYGRRGREVLYDVPACIEWYVGHASGGKRGALNLTEERARKEAALADKAELDNAQRRGELLEFEAVAREWASQIRAARSVFLALPTRLAPLVFGCTTIKQVEAIFRDGVDEGLGELSRN